VQWSAPGAYYPTGAGKTFATLWLTPGVKTVTASLCGSSKSKQVTIEDDCKHWDVGNEISGTIRVESAKLCEQKTHTSSILDKDHWKDCPCLEETPPDSLTYSWSKTVGSNPESGVFIGNTNQPSVLWQAPPCVGTVVIKLTANDVPDSMDEPCSGSTRNDPPKNFEDTSSVSLPEGCEFAGAHDSSVHWTDLTDYFSLTVTPYGQFGYWPATYEVDFKYNDCSWVCEISDVNAKTEILVRSPSSLLPDAVSVVMASQVPCIDANLAKWDLNDPNLTDDVGAPRSKYWCHIATSFHERRHRTDWKEFYGNKLAIAIANCESFQSVIDCGDPNTTTCQAAENYWKYPILAKFILARIEARDLYNDPSTTVDEAEVRAFAESYYWEHPISAALPEGCGS
jgi:hypothetical protein